MHKAITQSGSISYPSSPDAIWPCFAFILQQAHNIRCAELRGVRVRMNPAPFVSGRMGCGRLGHGFAPPPCQAYVNNFQPPICRSPDIDDLYSETFFQNN